jgi:hypothetical protein
MNPEMPNDLRKWETTRQKGKVKFILLHGVLAWGVPMFVVMTFFINRQRDTTPSIGMLLVSAVIWAIGGGCFGLAIWTFSEKRYQKYLATKDSGTMH